MTVDSRTLLEDHQGQEEAATLEVNFEDEPDSSSRDTGTINQLSDEMDEDSSSSSSRIGAWDASMHLIKGNLGPGCLNLPHAFGASGWLLGSCLFVTIAIQGIYSMTLLAEIKQALNDNASGPTSTMHFNDSPNYEMSSYQRRRRSDRTESQPRRDNTDETPQQQVSTFMDVAELSLGSRGKAIVQVFLFILQTGVCCVFLSLIATNLNAESPTLKQGTSILLVTLALLVVVWLRNLKDLRWLSASANFLMIVSIGTAVVAAVRQIRAEQVPLPPKGTEDLGEIATFTSSLFFAFEGIGLVLPVENAFVGKKIEGSSATILQSRNEEYRTRVLPRAMTVVATLFGVLGITGSWAFPDIQNGSITAYLAETFPDSNWFRIVNALVMVAVFLTFPLQLTPALEVLAEWTSSSRESEHDSSPSSNACVAEDDAEDEEAGDQTTAPRRKGLQLLPTADDTTVEETIAASSTPPIDHVDPWWKQYSWIIPRYILVLACAIVVGLVNDLGLLMSLFGAVGQTGLAAMPCLCHLALQRKGKIARAPSWKTLMDLCTILFATLVMLFGVIVSVERILIKVSSGESND